MGFQSLLLWIPLLNFDVNTPPQDLNAVSILVVMDTAPQQGSCGRGRSARGGSFNPCCYGYRSSTRNLVQRTYRGLCFNPCCYGYRSSTGVWSDALWEACLFQS